jgi:hypothetical protein
MSGVSISTKGMFQIPMFDGSHGKWPLWRQRVKAAMVARGWWSYLEKPGPATSASSLQASSSSPAKPEADEERNRACALSALTLALPDDLMSAYSPEDVTDPNVVWRKLCTHFESNSRMNKSHLRDKLAATRMAGNMTYLAYHTDLMTIVRSLKGILRGIALNHCPFCMLRKHAMHDL